MNGGAAVVLAIAIWVGVLQLIAGIAEKNHLKIRATVYVLGFLTAVICIGIAIF